MVGVGIIFSNSKDGVIFCLFLRLSTVFISKAGAMGEMSLLIVSDIVEFIAL